MTGELLHKFGRQLSEQIVRWHYERYQQSITTPFKTHIEEFNAAWNRFRARALCKFSPKEHAIFEQLRTEPLQEAFVLLRSFSSHAKGGDFPVGQSSLADRISITQRGAGYVIAKLEQLGAIKKKPTLSQTAKPHATAG